MKTISITKHIILLFSISIFFIAHIVIANNTASENKDTYLSNRESLIPMFVVTGLVSNEEFPFNRINPDVREYILFYLDKDNSVYDFAANGLRLLGFVGRNEDIEFVDGYLQSNLKNIENEERIRLGSFPNVALRSGAFAGIMIKRDIKGSKQFLQKYSQLSAWMPLEETSPQNIRLAKQYFGFFLVGAYQYSKAESIFPLLKQTSSDPNFGITKSLMDSLEKSKIGLYAECMEPSPTPERKLKDNIDKYLDQYGEWIDLLLKKQTLAQWQEAHEKQRTVSKAKKKTVDSFESVDMSETVEGERLKTIASEAVTAYMRISGKLAGRDAKDSPTKRVLQDIQKAGLNNYDGFRVKIEVEARIDESVFANKGAKGSVGNAAVPVVVKDKETADVTFNIRDTADIFNKHVPDAGDNSLTSSTTGDVKINMKRSNRKWNWGTASDSNVNSVADIVEDNYLIDSVNEAIIAYTQIARMIIDGNYDPLVIPVLDNCKLIPLEKRKKDKDDEMAEALDIEKRILEDVIIAKLNNYGDFHVKVEFESALNNFVPAINGVHGNEEISAKIGAMPVIVKGYETAIVTFIIRDTADIFKKYIPQVSDDTTIDDETGNLKVYMKRINGKWHWNPFGW